MSGLEAVGLILNATDTSYKVIAAALEYEQKVRTAKTCSENIRSEVLEITKLLDDLHLRARKAEESDDGSHIQQWTSLRDLDCNDSPVSQIRMELNTILGLLTTQKMSKIEQLLWPRKLKKVEKSMQSIVKQKKRLSDKMKIDTGFQTIETDKKIVEMARENRSATLRRAIEWLSDFDHTVYHQEACKERMETTGEWILDRSDFLSWKKSGNGFLWIYGPAGCGKTILSSTIIDALASDCERELNTITTYFYYKDGQRQGANDMLRAIVKQMCLQVNSIPEHIGKLIQKKYDKGERPNESSSLDMIKALAANAKSIYVVIDALDECCELLYLLKSLSTLSTLKLDSIRVLVTSRELPEIRRGIDRIASVQIPIGTSGIRDAGISDDIDLYIKRSLVDRYYLSIRPDKVKEKIRDTLVVQACGMFRWVACQLDQLSKPLTDDDLLEALGNLPKDLDETYDRMLQAVQRNGDKEAKMAYNLLKWLVTVCEPLTLEQAAEAMLQSVHSCSLTKRLPIVDATIEICVGLVKKVERKQGRTLEFVHFSVKEYLLSERIKSSPVSSFHIDLNSTQRETAQICLTYVFLFDQPDFQIMKIKDTHPLLLYACKYWLRHFKIGKCEEEMPIRDLAIRLFDLNRQRFFIMCVSMGSDRFRSGYVDSQLYYALESGLDEVVRILLENGADPNVGKGEHGYAIHIAAMSRSEEIVSLLLKYKANVNNIAGCTGTALAAACWKCRVNVVDLLLKNGADPSLRKISWTSPLMIACQEDSHEIVQKLLDNGVSREQCEEYLYIPAQNGNDVLFDMLLNYTNRQKLINPATRSLALYRACQEGHVAICQKLLKEDINVNFEYSPYSPTPLQIATEFQHEAVVKLLLDNGANANQQCGADGSALQIAAINGNDDIARLLIENGADPNCMVGKYGTALYRTVAGRHLSTAKLLIGNGADMHLCTDEKRGSAFQYAVLAGLIDWVKIFIEHGADVDREGERSRSIILGAMSAKYNDIVNLLLKDRSRDDILKEEYGSILHGAAAIGDEQMVRRLLESGLDVNLIEDLYSPLQAAVNHNEVSIARLLLENGADVNFSSSKFDNALHDAAYCGQLDMCRLLIDYKAQINQVQGECGTALAAAAYTGQNDVIRLLLKHGADVNLTGGKYGSPLAAAFHDKHVSGSTVNVLLAHGANPNYHGGQYGSVLQAACSGKRSTTTFELIDAGADIDYQGGDHPSPIEILHRKGIKWMVKEFVIRGAKIPSSLEGEVLYDETSDSSG